MSLPSTPGLAPEPGDSRGAVPEPEVPARATRRVYSARYKARIVAEYDRLDATGRGALLRREGLYTAHISKWRKLRDQGALVALAAVPGRPAADPASRNWRGCAASGRHRPHPDPL